MAIGCSDVVNTLEGLLNSAGYVIHNGNAETGATVQDESGPEWWFTWAAPGMADCESGPTCSISLEALASAVQHWLANASIPLHLND